MIDFVYSVKDDLCRYGKCFNMPNDAAAARYFRQACATPGTEWSLSPADFSLYRVGSFDDETGELTPAHEFVVRGVKEV